MKNTIAVPPFGKTILPGRSPHVNIPGSIHMGSECAFVKPSRHFLPQLVTLALVVVDVVGD